MAYDFTWIPTWVTPRARRHAVEITRSENFKKETYLLDGNSLRVFDLEFSGVTDGVRNAISGHYSNVTGPYSSFEWTTVPSYLNAGTTMDVHYIPGSFREEPEARSWVMKMSFERDVV